MTIHHRSSDRHHMDHGWVSIRASDPLLAQAGLSVLPVFHEGIIRPNTGFPKHSHRDMEIVTYVIDGVVAHEDSSGGKGEIAAGQVQRMSTGSGIGHSEFNPSTTTPAHVLQIWITPNVMGVTPQYEERTFSQADRHGKLTPLVSGQNMDGVMDIYQDATVYGSYLTQGEGVQHPLSDGRQAYVFVIDGKITLNNLVLEPQDAALVSDEDLINITATETSNLLLLDLP